jgi:hypothetical protein
MSEFLMRMPIYDGISAPRVRPPPCSCCAPAFTMPPLFANNATLTDLRLRHHANISGDRRLCGFDDCPICGGNVPALSDLEDDNPAFFCRPMPNDQDDPEVTETLVPPTDREGEDRDTKPPGAADAEATRAAATMLPGAPSAPSAPAPPEYWKAAYDKLVEIHEEQRTDRRERQGRDDALVSRLSAAAKEASESSVTHLTTALGEIAQSVERIATRMETLEETDAQQTKRLAEGDKRFADIEQALAELRNKFETLSADLAAAKAANAQRPPAPAAPG